MPLLKREMGAFAMGCLGSLAERKGAKKWVAGLPLSCLPWHLCFWWGVRGRGADLRLGRRLRAVYENAVHGLPSWAACGSSGACPPHTGAQQCLAMRDSPEPPLP